MENPHLSDASIECMKLCLRAKVSGKVLVDDKDIYDSDIDPVDIRRRIGMVFQKPNPFPTMSIRDNVVAGLKLSGVKDKKILDQYR